MGMKFAVVDHQEQVIESKSFTGIAADAASRMFPVKRNILGFDVNAVKRSQAEKAIFDVLHEIALEVMRR